MEIERHKKMLGPAKLVESLYLLLLLLICFGIAYIGLGGELHGVPIISTDPDVPSVMRVDEPVFMAAAIALLIAIANVCFAKVRQHEQEIIQLEVSRLADERQQREWTRQADMVDKQREEYSAKMVEGLGNELAVVKMLYQAMLEDVPEWDESDSQQTRNAATQRFFSLYYNFTPTRPIFDAIGLKLVDLPEHCISAVIRFQNQYADLHKKVKAATSDANYFDPERCREPTRAMIVLIDFYQSELYGKETTVTQSA